MPALAERREDIPELVEYFMTQISQTTGLPKRNVGADALAVLQSHDWPGNVRQLRNNVERLMILAGGEPDAVITAAMLPQDVGWMIPNMPNGNGGEHLMSLRCARRAKCSSANICWPRSTASAATFRAPPSSSAWNARRCTASSRRWGSTDRRDLYVPNRLCQRPLSAAREAKVHVEDRGYQFADGVYEVCEVRDGRLIDERRHMERLTVRSPNCAFALPMSLRALDCPARSRATNRIAYGIVYLQITRGVARRDLPFRRATPCRRAWW